MSEAPGDEELPMVLFGEGYGDMLPEGGGSPTDIHGDIQNDALHTTYEFTLSMRRGLEVEPSHDPIGGEAFVVLYELYRTDEPIKLTLGEGLEEVAPLIFEELGFDDDHALEGGMDDVHD